jgi:hypothetical protein
MSSENRTPDSTEIRLAAIKAATNLTSPSGGVGNMLIHARWIENYITTGESPEVASGGSQS